MRVADTNGTRQLSMTTDLLSFPREIGLKRANCDNIDRFRQYIKSLNGKSDIYTSLYAFENPQDKERTAIIDRAWWDFDANDRYGIEQVKLDTAVLIERLEGDVRVVATGRGFHIHQMFDESVQGIHWARTLDRYQRKMAEGLKSLDGVGYPRKLARIPLTYNARRGRWSVMIDANEMASNPLKMKIPKKPSNDMNNSHPFWGHDRKKGFCLKQWAQDNPVDISGYVENQITEITGTDEVPMIPCLSKSITVSNPQHDIRVALAQYLFENLRNFAPPTSLTTEQTDSMVEKALKYMKSLGWTDFNAKITKQHLYTLVSYGRAPSCAWFHQRGLCEARCWREDGTLPL